MGVTKGSRMKYSSSHPRRHRGKGNNILCDAYQSSKLWECKSCGKQKERNKCLNKECEVYEGRT